MQTCTNCGTAFEGYVCPNCGKAVELGYQQQYTPPPQQPTYAPQQGQYQQPPPQGQYPPPPGAAPVYAPIPPAAQKTGPSKVLIAIILVVVVVIASFAAAILFIGVTNPFHNAREVFSGDQISGTMSGSGTDDFYKIELDPGEILNVTLTGAGGTDFDLYAYENVLFWDEYIITGSAHNTSSETMSLVAWESAYYILDVYSYMGSGDYTMTSEITRTISLDDGDNSISSAYPLDSGDTILGNLNEHYDADDYYEIYVNQGQILHAFLEVPVQVNTDFDLYVFGPSGNQLDTSEAAYGNEELNVYAQTSGYYYVNVRAYDGIGIYSLYVETLTGTGTDSNNDLDSAERVYNGAYFSASINEYDDTDDYYSIYLNSGDTITVSMTGPGDADFDLYLYDDYGDIAAQSGEYTSSETIVYTAPSDGYYYVNPYAYSGFGTYYLGISVGNSQSVYANAGYDRTVATGQSITFDGTASSGPIISYTWDFGDGSTGSGATTTHSYSSTGTYTVTLSVSDGGSTTSSDDFTVTVQDSGSMPDKYALVIGISDYQGDGDLNFCDEDAEAWTSYLESQGYTVHTLIDSQASRDDIFDEISWLETQEEAGDYVAFVFSGHGSYSDRTRSSYICAWNIEEQDGFISDADLGAAFDNFDSQHILFFFDSCHSGGMDSVSGPGRFVSQTAGQLEYGLDAPKHEHGMWVYWFLEYAVEEQGDVNLVQAQNLAAPLATNDAASGQNEMHPEMEYSGSSFYL